MSESNSRFSDDAKRLCNAVGMTQWVIRETGETDRRWLAVQLYDGSTDGEVYYSKDDAVRHQKFPWLCAYLWVPPTGMSVAEAETWLAVWRKAKQAGFDTESDRSYITPLTIEGISSHLAMLGK